MIKHFTFYYNNAYTVYKDARLLKSDSALVRGDGYKPESLKF
jgi:hypothetical protein